MCKLLLIKCFYFIYYVLKETVDAKSKSYLKICTNDLLKETDLMIIVFAAYPNNFQLFLLF